MKTARDVQVYVVFIKLESHTLLKHRDQKTHSVVVKAVRGPFRRRVNAFRHERLYFRYYRSRALDNAPRARAAGVFRALSHNDLTRIRYLDKPRIAHFEHAYLVGRAVTVLYRAYYSVRICALAFEIKHRVNHMLKELRTRNSAFFIDVTHEKYGSPVRFRVIYEGHSSLAHLRYASGCR